eukprot:scaffold41837_cov22-Tisochrysis_lutea.AAC.3
MLRTAGWAQGNTGQTQRIYLKLCRGHPAFYPLVMNDTLFFYTATQPLLVKLDAVFKAHCIPEETQR